MIRKILAVLLVSTAALLMAEVVLRSVAPVYTVGIQEAYQYDPELGARLKPGVHLLNSTDHQEEIRTNRLGTVNFQESFREYSTLIFAIGDSYTQGTGLPADASYPFQLDLILNRDGKGAYLKRYGVVNLGLSPSGAEQAVIALRRHASQIGKPAIVLYLGADNDYGDDLLFQRGYGRQHLVDGSPYWGWMLRPLRWVAMTQIGTRLRLARGNRHRAQVIPPGEGGAAGPPVSQLEQPGLEKIAAACAEQGAYLIVSWANAPSASYDWIKAWAASKGAGFADWVPAVESVRTAIPQLPLLNPHSGGHKRSWVNRVIAEEFAKQIRLRSRSSP